MVLSGAVGLAVAGSAGCDSGSSTPKGTGGAGGKAGVGGSGVGGSVGGGGSGVGGSGVGGSTSVGGAGGAAGGSDAGGSTGAGGAGGSLTPMQIHTMIINAPGSGDVPLSITTTPVAYPACN
jgi:hypothetical protein